MEVVDARKLHVSFRIFICLKILTILLAYCIRNSGWIK
jgi:hypothetical protein